MIIILYNKHTDQVQKSSDAQKCPAKKYVPILSLSTADRFVRAPRVMVWMYKGFKLASLPLPPPPPPPVYPCFGFRSAIDLVFSFQKSIFPQVLSTNTLSA